MSIYKFIYINKEDLKKSTAAVSIHYLVGYNQRTLKDFKDMVRELRKYFPSFNKDSVRCGCVFKSSFADGFSIIALDTLLTKAELDKAEVEGFSIKTGFPGYYW